MITINRKKILLLNIFRKYYYNILLFIPLNYNLYYREVYIIVYHVLERIKLHFLASLIFRFCIIYSYSFFASNILLVRVSISLDFVSINFSQLKLISIFSLILDLYLSKILFTSFNVQLKLSISYYQLFISSFL